VAAGGVDWALRDIWFGQVWRAFACRLIEDHGDLLVLWLPAGSPGKIPVGPDGRELRIPRRDRVLGDRAGGRDALALIRPMRRHSIWLFWADVDLDYWYVNFERPLGRSAVGFDQVDEKLDLIVSPDGVLRWKDEDELAEAAALGLVDADEVRAEAARVLADWPFPTGWEDWRPDPVWSLPELPGGWEIV